ncbi:MAG: TrkA family potassium uptake protein [Halobacterium sp.]
MYVIIVGAGDIGSQLIDLAVTAGYEVVVVEKDDAVASQIASEYDCLVINGDATVQETLVDAGAADADAIIATTESDAANVMVMLLAEELDVPSKVSVVQNPDHMDLFRRIGVNVLENPQRLISEYLFRAVQRPSVKDFMTLAGDAEVFEITVTDDAPVAGMTLSDADEAGVIPDDVRVVAVERNHEVLPAHGDTTVEPGDLVTVFSMAGATQDVSAVFAGD